MKDINNEMQYIVRLIMSQEGLAKLPVLLQADCRKGMKKSGVMFPSDLITWLSCCNGVICGGGELFGVRNNNKKLDIPTIINLFDNWKKYGWIPIAGDGCGNYYILDSKNRKGSSGLVYFVDVCYDCEELDYVASSNLWSFLRFYVEREYGEDRWPFDKEYVLSRDPHIIECSNAPMPWDVD